MCGRDGNDSVDESEVGGGAGGGRLVHVKGGVGLGGVGVGLVCVACVKYSVFNV